MKGTRLDIAQLSTVFPSTDRPSGNLLGVDHTTSYRFYGRYFTKVLSEKTFPKEKQQFTHILHTGFYCFKHVFIFWHSKILFPAEVVVPCFSYFFLKKERYALLTGCLPRSVENVDWNETEFCNRLLKNPKKSDVILVLMILFWSVQRD